MHNSPGEPLRFKKITICFAVKSNCFISLIWHGKKMKFYCHPQVAHLLSPSPISQPKRQKQKSRFANAFYIALFSYHL